MENWYRNVQSVTERFLTWRKIRKEKKLEKQRAKHPVVDWLEAFLWAAGVVLLINQYFFQAYQIPSGSMETTLLIRDRIFVNKMIYGPELIPGRVKLPGFAVPERDDVIIFESPTYLSKGPAFDVLQRVLYMLTLSIVDIDRDEYGNPKAHFLIKRAIGVEKDRLRVDMGNLEYRPPGEQYWIKESDFKRYRSPDYTVRRLVEPSEYKEIRLSAQGDAYESSSLQMKADQSKAWGNSRNKYNDLFAWSEYRYETLYAINPGSNRYGSLWRTMDSGWYVPKGWIFPMGDNRDNSRDARYFGPVRLRYVLGGAMFKYWPLYRIGIIR